MHKPTEVNQDLEVSSTKHKPVSIQHPKYITEYESEEETTEIIHPHTPIPPMDPKLVTTLRSVFGSGKIVSATELPEYSNKNFLSGQLYFVSNSGTKIPLKITKNISGKLQLTLDVTKLCPLHCQHPPPCACQCKCASSESSESSGSSASSGSYESSCSDESPSRESGEYSSESGSEEYEGAESNYPYYYQNNRLSKGVNKVTQQETPPVLQSLPSLRSLRRVRREALELTTLMEKNSFIRNHFAHLNKNSRLREIARFNRHLDHQVFNTTVAPPVETVTDVTHGTTTEEVEPSRMDDGTTQVPGRDGDNDLEETTQTVNFRRVRIFFEFF